jgi:predicted methyltransferase
VTGVKSLFVILAVSGGIAGVAIAQAVIPDAVKSALADPGRPATDVARDMSRKPGELVTFAGIKPGDQVIDFIPGGGYFTRIFSDVVGPHGHVYATVPKPAEAMEAKDTATIASFAASHPNVSVIIAPLGQYAAPSGPVDVFWTSQNYHDLYNAIDKSTGKAVDLVAFNRLVLAALKPGGTYVVVDHVAPAGSGAADTKTLHRIDPALVKKDVIAAGFVFEGESDVLQNPADPHTAMVYDPSIRGRTDQFAFKFRKPR